MNTNWPVRGETDLEIYGSIAELQLGIPLLILFLFGKSVLVKLYQFKYVIHQITELFKSPVRGTAADARERPRAYTVIYLIHSRTSLSLELEFKQRTGGYGIVEYAIIL